MTWTWTSMTDGAAGASSIVTPNALPITSRGFVCKATAADSTWLAPPTVSVATTVRITLPALTVTVSMHAGKEHCSSWRKRALTASAFASYSSTVPPTFSTKVTSLAGTISLTAPGCNGDGGGGKGGGGEGGGGEGGGGVGALPGGYGGSEGGEGGDGEGGGGEGGGEEGGGEGGDGGVGGDGGDVGGSGGRGTVIKGAASAVPSVYAVKMLAVALYRSLQKRGASDSYAMQQPSCSCAQPEKLAIRAFSCIFERS